MAFELLVDEGVTGNPRTSILPTNTSCRTCLVYVAYESEGTHEEGGAGVRGEGRADPSVGARRGTESSITAVPCCTGQHANLN